MSDEQDISEADGAAFLCEMLLPIEEGTVINLHFGEEQILDRALKSFGKRISVHLEPDGREHAGTGAGDHRMETVFCPCNRLQLAPESTDCILLPGTLGMLSGMETGSTSAVTEAAFLVTVYNALRPGGLVAVCAHNRLSPQNILSELGRSDTAPSGRRAPLGRMRSYFGYASLLRRTGFAIVTAHAIIPGYECPAEIVSLTRRASSVYFDRQRSILIRHWLDPRNLASRLLDVLNLHPYIQGSFFIVARK